MKTKRKAKVATRAAFWDTSALIPLCCFQTQSARARMATRSFGHQVVWWATIVEAIASLNRLARIGNLGPREMSQAFARLEHLRYRWSEVQPIDSIREQAERLLRTHKLRAADALQLAAALQWCAQHPRGRTFIGGDNDLSRAAEAEGFSMIHL